ncbi:Na/Pi cotransporter family protein [Marinimicrobium sp. LS-A18]|uniref:Na/Pi cotransporter family protein n=1 Tax=Marinimicrobium sp. LS-A18 TaxID=1381596 RepID=UPI0004642CE9|nr:Na/Pi symporter [Marinimicrobium sp. LS-A18]
MVLIRVLVEVLGGLGLFLLGMTLMTEGLKAMAGDAIRRVLMRFTRSPVSGVLAGLVGTAVLQSSSATIVATVGFVGAGLIGFSQALGIIFGSALGTTVTGWIVALIGFKLKLSLLAALFVFAGAMLKLFGRRSLGGLGYALAGFGLIFIGIDTLQGGLEGLREQMDFSQFPADDLWGKFQLVVIGVLFTIVTQSSSAGVVAALTALHTDTIAFEQAASLVVGMNIGTSFTAAAATIGGNVSVRRTGFSHVLYNTGVSSLALFLIVPYITAWQFVAPEAFVVHEEFALVGFHSAFNLLGVLLVVPFAGQFAHMIERLFPDKPFGYQQVLDRGLLKYPELALTAVQKVMISQFERVAEQLEYILGESGRSVPLVDLARELSDVQEYLDAIHLEGTSGSQWERLLAAIQIVEHLQRLLERCDNKSVAVALRNGDDLAEAKAALSPLVLSLWGKRSLPADQVQERVAQITQIEQTTRRQTMNDIAQGRLELRQGVARMEVVRWLQRVAVHIGRIDVHTRELNYQQP